MPREASAPWTTPASPSRAVRPTAGAARPATAARPPPRWPDRPLRQDGGRSENLLGLLPQEVQPIELGKEDEEAGIGDPETHPASSRAARISASICSSRRLIAETPIRSSSRRKVIRFMPAKRAAFPEDRRPIS